MGRVISGKYEGGKIKPLNRGNCLYISYDDEDIPLDSLRVAKYELKQRTINPFINIDKIYTITWEDGTKSVIGIENAYETYLVTGCDTSTISDSDSEKMLSKQKTEKRILFVIVLIIIIIGAVFLSGTF